MHPLPSPPPAVYDTFFTTRSSVSPHFQAGSRGVRFAKLKKVSTLSADVDSPPHHNAIEVVLDARAGHTVHYTLDGSTPEPGVSEVRLPVGVYVLMAL